MRESWGYSAWCSAASRWPRLLYCAYLWLSYVPRGPAKSRERWRFNQSNVPLWRPLWTPDSQLAGKLHLGARETSPECDVTMTSCQRRRLLLEDTDCWFFIVIPQIYSVSNTFLLKAIQTPFLFSGCLACNKKIHHTQLKPYLKPNFSQTMFIT